MYVNSCLYDLKQSFFNGEIKTNELHYSLFHNKMHIT